LGWWRRTNKSEVLYFFGDFSFIFSAIAGVSLKQTQKPTNSLANLLINIPNSLSLCEYKFHLFKILYEANTGGGGGGF
jgi:hypothetical protein